VNTKTLGEITLKNEKHQKNQNNYRRQTMKYPDIILPRLQYQYCPMCQGKLIRKIINDDRIERVVCQNCNWVHYPSSALGVSVLITTSDGIVAILPPKAPVEYPAALPGGHAEYGESPEEAAIRESKEETGLDIEIVECLGWEFKKNIGYPGPMVSFYFHAHAIGGEIKSSEEGRVTIYKINNFPAISPDRGGSRKTMELFLSKCNRESK
jgi:8-oxo-dGTP diphosphatase